MILAKRAVLGLCLLLTTTLYAQFETSEVLGTVLDPSGSPVPNATVDLPPFLTQPGSKNHLLRLGPASVQHGIRGS
jgi:hypothetical protein